MKMVNDHRKNLIGREREFLIECGLCWYEVQEYSGYSLFRIEWNDVLWKESGKGLVF